MEANPFRYRGYYYDTESGLYYLNSRYYDPATGRFLNEDTISYLEPEILGGLNLYAYCLNNPVMITDPSGYSILAIIIILTATTVIGAAIGAKVAYDDGKEGWDFAKSIILGAALGFAAGGLLVTIGAGGASLAHLTFFGCNAARAFSLGLLAYNTVAATIAPLFNLDMELIEPATLPNTQEYSKNNTTRIII